MNIRKSIQSQFSGKAFERPLFYSHEGGLDVEIIHMRNFKRYDYNQDTMVVINFEEQLPPKIFEFTLHHLIDDHIDLSVFHISKGTGLQNRRFALVLPPVL